ncbi:hypothetical protein EV361DRAFT_941755 [Lentinula raphanica]|nr:hypothetical protein EV361DRAFT_941755 [Lentinula raphanica]
MLNVLLLDLGFQQVSSSSTRTSEFTLSIALSIISYMKEMPRLPTLCALLNCCRFVLDIHLENTLFACSLSFEHDFLLLVTSLPLDTTGI